MIKIFVGTSKNGEDTVAEKTLEYSLRKHCQEDLEINFMRNTENGIFGKFDDRKWATPFTNLRWAIPEYCNFEGRAIYMDVDQLNLRDISELYNTDMGDRPFASRNNRLCVMVLDCEKMKNHLKPISQIKKDSAYGTNIYWNILKQGFDIDPRWNCLDGENRAIPDIWHLHFTGMPTQPWKPSWFKGIHKEHPRQDLVALWKSFAKEAGAM